MTKRILIKVHGHVQGVFFRHATRRFARRLGISGRVKNLADGSVRIIAEGPEEKLYQLLKFSKKGPEHAKVERVEFEFSKAENKYHGFDYDF